MRPEEVQMDVANARAKESKDRSARDKVVLKAGTAIIAALRAANVAVTPIQFFCGPNDKGVLD
eukprot:6378652-Heterocapsa_arctica.AAC.1